MKNRISFLVFIFFLFSFESTSILAQNYSHSPNDTLIAYTFLDGQVTMNITQIHPTDDTLHFSWNLLEVDMPIEWEANICDNSACFTSLVSSGSTLPVLPGDNGLMLVHCTPHLIPGTATIRYTIYELNSPQQVDTLTWIIHTSTASVLDENEIKEPFILLSENQLILKGDLSGFTKIKVLDQLGRVLLEDELTNQENQKIALFQAGFVWVELRGDSVKMTKKVFVCF